LDLDPTAENGQQRQTTLPSNRSSQPGERSRSTIPDGIHRTGDDPHVVSLAFLGIVFFCLGFPDQANSRRALAPKTTEALRLSLDRMAEAKDVSEIVPILATVRG